MHHTIDYATLPTRKERDAAALRDCKRYLGPSAYKKTLAGIRAYWVENEGHSKATLFRGSRMSLGMFVGIEGRYPVRAILREALRGLPPRTKAKGRPHLTLILTGATRTHQPRRT